jgi:hypothetical protein
VSVLVVDFDGSDQGLANYSPAKETKIPLTRYVKSQAIVSGLINLVINGIIAFFSYRARTHIPAIEAAIDVPITVAIISFLVSWLTIGGVRTEIIKGNLSTLWKGWRGIKIPRSATLGALLITFVCVIFFGGLILDGLIFLITPSGFSNWAYIIFKTLYTGASASLASVLTILSVVSTEKRK